MQFSPLFISNWSHHLDGRRLITSILLKLEDAPITWENKLQFQVATTTIEAKYQSMNITTKDITWTKALLHDLNIEMTKSKSLLCDTQRPTKLVKSQIFHFKD